MRTGWNRSVRYIESKPRSTGPFVACRGAQPLANGRPSAGVPQSAAPAHPKILPPPNPATGTFPVALNPQLKGDAEKCSV